MTLPLIYLLNNSTWLEKRRIINVVKNNNDNPRKVAALIQQVKETGGIAYAEERMLAYREQALDILREFKESPARESLEKLVVFTTERKS